MIFPLIKHYLNNFFVIISIYTINKNIIIINSIYILPIKTISSIERKNICVFIMIETVILIL